MQVPEHDTRYCKTCQAFLPLDQFKSGPRRFHCNVHLIELNHRQHTPATTEERAARSLWTRCWQDTVRSFGQPTMAIAHKEVLHMLAKLKQDPRNYLQLYMLPRSPLQPGTPSNVFLATKPQRKYLVELWKMTKSAAEYAEAVKLFDLLPPMHLQ